MTPPDESYLLIPLTQGQFAKVSPEDYPELSKHKWCAHWQPQAKTFYAVRLQWNPESKRSHTVYMHRQILKAPKGIQIDHRNHDTLCNTRENLRLATGAQNRQNSRIRRNNKSGSKGVDWHKASQKWRGAMSDHIHIGLFDTAEQAARAYDAVAIALYGEFADTNFQYQEKDPLLLAKAIEGLTEKQRNKLDRLITRILQSHTG